MGEKKTYQDCSISGLNCTTDDTTNTKVPLKNDTIRDAVNDWIKGGTHKTETENKYGHISYWDVSQVTDMSRLFKDRWNFNDDISRWNVSNVTNMADMFNRARAFNQDISNWNVSKVTNMSKMFYHEESFDNAAFNKPLGNWERQDENDVSTLANVTNMSEMFFFAQRFTRDISNWNVSRVNIYFDFRKGSPLSQYNAPRFR